MHCNAEFRQLKQIYPAYADRVAMLAVDTDPTESEDVIRRYQAANGFPWPMAKIDPEAVARYKIVIQSTKFGIDRKGTIVWRGDYGTYSAEEWERWLKALAGG